MGNIPAWREGLREARSLLDDLRAGRKDTYLNIYRVMFAYGLKAEHLQTTDRKLRTLRRALYVQEAKRCLAMLEAGTAAAYDTIMKMLMQLHAVPDKILGKTHAELIALWRKAERRRTEPSIVDFDRGVPDAAVILLDHLTWLDRDPAWLGLDKERFGMRWPLDPWFMELLAAAGLPLDIGRVFGRHIVFRLPRNKHAHPATIRGVTFSGFPAEEMIASGKPVGVTMCLSLAIDDPTDTLHSLDPALVFNGASWTLLKKIGGKARIRVATVRFL